jgi:streptomycin 6-kinase
VALVCSAVRAGVPAVLKLNPRRNPEEGLIAAEASALEFWAPTGAAVRLLDEREGRMTLLLERVSPGDALDDSNCAWEEKLEILGGLVARLHAAGPPPASMPSLSDYAALWRAQLDHDAALVSELEALIATTADEVLLHGDLHPGNALRAAEGWRVIDPTAIRGDRHADVWALICPQAPTRRIREGLERYCAIAGLDPERALGWARVRAAAECSDWIPSTTVNRMR